MVNVTVYIAYMGPMGHGDERPRVNIDRVCELEHGPYIKIVDLPGYKLVRG